MKFLTETQLSNEDSMYTIQIYAINKDEYWYLIDAAHDEKCEFFGVDDYSGYPVPPGEPYKTCDIDVETCYAIVKEHLTFNV